MQICSIFKCDFLRDLVPFVQFKKREKHQSRSVTLSKVVGFYPGTLLKVILLYGCFSRFLNCTIIPNLATHHTGKELTVNVKSCQQQANGVDCGDFLIANMFHISTDADIGSTKIGEDKMNDHLLQCIKSGEIQELEKSNSSDIAFCKIKKIKFQIICYCRFSWAC